MDISRMTINYECAPVTVKGVAHAEGLLYVPMGLPSASRVLSIDGRASAEATAADGAVSANGSVTLNVIYADEQGGVYGFESVAAFTHEEHSPMVKSGATVRVNATVGKIEHTVTAGAVDVHAELKLSFSVYPRTSAACVSSVSGDDVQERRSLTPYFVLEKNSEELGLTDEVRLPRTAERLLCATGSAGVRSIVAEGARAIVNGVLRLSVTFLAADKTPVQSPFSLPFEAAIAIAPGASATFASVRLLSLETTLTGEDAIAIDAAAELTVYALYKKEAELTADAYSLTKQLNVEFAELSTREDAAFSCRSSLRLELPVPEGMPDAERVLCASLRPWIESAEPSDGAVRLSGGLFASMVYMCGEGKLHGVDAVLPIECECEARDARFGMHLYTDADCELIHAAGAANALSLQCAIECTAMASTTTLCSAVTNATTGGDRAGEYGPVVYFPEEGETAWDIGRRFGVSLSELYENNPELESATPAAVLVNMRRTG